MGAQLEVKEHDDPEVRIVCIWTYYTHVFAVEFSSMYV